MRTIKTTLVVALATLAASLVSANARADAISISLPAAITVTRGELSVIVTGTLTNNTLSPLDVLGSETVPGADPLSLIDLSPFTLNGGPNGPMNLFSFNVLSSAALGAQVGNYTIFDSLGKSYSANFTVNIVSPTVVPEPGTLLLFGSGLASLGLLRRRAKL